MKNFRAILLAFFAILALLPLDAIAQKYRVAVCDWMILKRQKIGEFQLAREMGADGVEMDMGGLGARDTFDNKLRQPNFRELFPRTAREVGVEVPSVAMSGFFGQNFLNKATYVELLQDCFQTMEAMGAKVAFLPLGGIQDKWQVAGPARKDLVRRLKTVGDMAAERGLTIGIRTGLPAAEARALLKEIDSKGVKIYWNLQDALDQNLNPVKEIQTLGRDAICQIHITNTDGYNLREDPEVDLPAIKKALDRIGWTGWLVVERSRDASNVRDVKGNFSRNVAYIKEVFLR